MPLIIFGLLMGSILVGTGIWTLLKARSLQRGALADQARARGWSETQARVLSAQVKDVTHGHGRSRVVKAVPDIEYEYQAGGLTGARASASAWSSSTWRRTRRRWSNATRPARSSASATIRNSRATA